VNKIERWLNVRAANKLANQIKESNAVGKAIRNSQYEIPVLVVCFNNARYLLNIIKQLNDRSIVPLIIDNKSTDAYTIDTLTKLNDSQAIVVRSAKNLGHLVGFLEPIYRLLPETFAYTDPDLQFNSDLPQDFLIQLAKVAELYECYKAGMALDIYNSGEIRDIFSRNIRNYPFKFKRIHSVLNWEEQFWKMPLKHENLEVYAANIDTTFAVYQKRFFNGEFAKGVRVAGQFTAVHLPWFEHLDIVSEKDRENYARAAQCSVWIKP
jgi:hypothetical protein